MRSVRVLLYLLMPFAFLLIPALFFGCATAPNYWEGAGPSQKKVLVSFPPLYALTHAVAGDDAYVLSLLTTVGPHGHQGHAADLLKVNKADLYIYNGLTLDDQFSDRMLKNRRNKDLTIVNVGAILDQRDTELPKDEKLLIRGEKVKHLDHWHGAEDPHYWLSPKVAIAMTEIIAAKLAVIDPAHAKDYEKRAAESIKELKELEQYGIKAFAGKKGKKILTMHDSLKYFTKHFGLDEPVPIQATAGADPDATKLNELVKQCRNAGSAVIAIEPQYPKRQAEILKNSLKREGIDVQIITLDPLETADVVAGTPNPDPKYYLQKMRENIDTLAKALP